MTDQEALDAVRAGTGWTYRLVRDVDPDLGQLEVWYCPEEDGCIAPENATDWAPYWWVEEHRQAEEGMFCAS